MDLAFDLDAGAATRLNGANPPHGQRPNWPDLLACMIAAREASAALARERRVVLSAEHGSFHEEAAAQVTAFAARTAVGRDGVNPNDLGYSNSGGVIASSVAGVTRTGGRG